FSSASLCYLVFLIFLRDIATCYFFFFQAEDGIRDLIVTGVQTCALPICGYDAPRGREVPFFGVLRKIIEDYVHRLPPRNARRHTRERAIFEHSAVLNRVV